MSTRRLQTLILLACGLCALIGCGGGESRSAAATADAAPSPASISGRISEGLRVLTVDPAAPGDFTVYRGDYVRLETTDGAPVTITIPELKVEKSYPAAEGDKPYFKVPDAGSFAYTIGAAGGTITAVDYAASGYQEVDAAEAAALIRNISPFVLDVRTPNEFASGHLEGAHLLPVQVLQKEIGSLPAKKDEPVFVYCQSGNRSTVAAKILMDYGFEQVINLRHGIREWQKVKLPVVK
ncbi:rhodanese-like domain-containing protein [bacterium]|nr:rhodanese-like domain-containing protein [bacterium]